MAVLATFSILGPAPAGRLPTLHLAVVTAPRHGSASFTDRPTPLAASQSRRRGCPSSGPPGPPARLGSLHPRASGSFRCAGYTGARATRIRLVSVGPASSDHVPPWLHVPLHHGSPSSAARPPSTRSAVRRCAFGKATRLNRSQMRLGSAQRIAASVSAQGRPCADPRSILVGGPP